MDTTVAPLARARAAPAAAPLPTGTAFESVALLLQGGGALGAYQAGVYEGILEAGIEPSWVAGISIGAVNSAIIAGNPPERRIERLRAFWELVCPTDLGDDLTAYWRTGEVRSWLNQLAAVRALAGGVRGLLKRRIPPPTLRAPGTRGAISWYDAEPLRSTLEQLVDFDRINSRKSRFSVGAVNVRTGNFAYFDNATERITVHHVMASAALPPAFDPVEIDGEYYWDGGLVSNTPLDWVLSSKSRLDSLIFQVDLWSARGELPCDLAEVAARMKDIQYSSRTRAATDDFRNRQRLRAAFNELFAKLPQELAATPAAELLARASDPAVYNIVQLVYRSPDYESQSKDYDFSRRTMEEHWTAGRLDVETTLSHPEVLALPQGDCSVQVFDFLTPSPRRGAVRTERDVA